MPTCTGHAQDKKYYTEGYFQLVTFSNILKVVPCDVLHSALVMFAGGVIFSVWDHEGCATAQEVSHCFSPEWPRFNPRPVQVRFMVEKVALGQVSSE